MVSMLHNFMNQFFEPVSDKDKINKVSAGSVVELFKMYSNVNDPHRLYDIIVEEFGKGTPELKLKFKKGKSHKAIESYIKFYLHLWDEKKVVSTQEVPDPETNTVQTSDSHTEETVKEENTSTEEVSGEPSTDLPAETEDSSIEVIWIKNLSDIKDLTGLLNIYVKQGKSFDIRIKH